MPQSHVRCRANRKFANATSRGTSNGLELFRNRGFKLINGRNDTTAFLPLSVKGGPCISHNSKPVNPSGKSTIKITRKRANDGIEIDRKHSPKANDGIEIDRKYSSEATNGIEKNKLCSPETNNGIEMNRNYGCNEITTDLMINPYKRVILKKTIKIKIKYPWKTGLF